MAISILSLILSILALIVCIYTAWRITTRNRPDAAMLCASMYIHFIITPDVVSLTNVLDACNRHNVDFELCKALAFEIFGEGPVDEEDEQDFQEETYVS